MEIIRVLRRDVGAQFAWSRNLKESIWTKVVRMFWSVLYLFKALRVAINAMRREQLGSRVIYQGRECFISNWAGSEYPNLASEGFYESYVPRSEIVNVVNAKEIWHRFCFGFSFYMGSWYVNDVNARLYGRYESDA